MMLLEHEEPESAAHWQALVGGHGHPLAAVLVSVPPAEHIAAVRSLSLPFLSLKHLAGRLHVDRLAPATPAASASPAGLSPLFEVLSGFGPSTVVVDEELVRPGLQSLLVYEGGGRTRVLPPEGFLEALRGQVGAVAVKVLPLDKTTRLPEERQGVITRPVRPNPKPARVHHYNETACYREAEGGGQDAVFAHMRTSPHAPLHAAAAAPRVACPRCHKSGKFFCTVCFAPLLPDPAASVPRVRLPLAVDILKHEQEHGGKSTAVHARILAPDHVRLLSFPSFAEVNAEPGGEDGEVAPYAREDTLVLFPGPGSLALEEVEGLERVTRLVLLDASWLTVGQLGAHPRLAGLRQVRITEGRGHFWRYAKDPSHLSTVEALWRFMQDYTRAWRSSSEGQGDGEEPTHEYDDLLFFFTFLHGLVGRQMMQQK